MCKAYTSIAGQTQVPLAGRWSRKGERPKVGSAWRVSSLLVQADACPPRVYTLWRLGVVAQIWRLIDSCGGKPIVGRIGKWLLYPEKLSDFGNQSRWHEPTWLLVNGRWQLLRILNWAPDPRSGHRVPMRAGHRRQIFSSQSCISHCASDRRSRT